VETFGDLRLGIAELGTQRRNRTREKPVFPAYSRVSLGAWGNARLLGWRRSADRTRLQMNSLQTGNLTGNFALWASERRIEHEKPLCCKHFWKVSLRQ